MRMLILVFAVGLNIFYSEISTEIAHCTHSNKDQNESKYLLSSSPRRINW